MRACEHRCRYGIKKEITGKPTTTSWEHTYIYAHSVVHCGLGIGLAAGKCCAERIGEQGSDVGLERNRDEVAAKTVVRSASKISNGSRQEISEEAPSFLFIKASGQKSLKPHHSLTAAV